ncbi:MAG: ABC transporter permease [Clostridia bacterium]|nr:ABC transporter permease [Clostridia bacterium]
MSARIKGWIQNNLVLATILLLVLVTVILEPKFMSMANLGNIMNQFGPLSFVSLGMTIAIVGGFIDLSVAGIVSLTAVFTLSMIDVLGQVGALLSGVALGALLGLVNALILISSGALSQAKAVFITYGLSAVYSALALLYTDGATQHMSYLQRPITLFQAIGSGRVGFVPLSFMLFIAAMLLLHVFLTRTRTGREILLTGANMTAAELAGIPVRRRVAQIFMLCGCLSALGAILLFSRITTASPLLGANYETNAILAVVVGGTSLAGGRGSVVRTMLGVMLVTLLSNCLNLLGVSTYLQTVCKGAVLIAAIWIDRRRTK